VGSIEGEKLPMWVFDEKTQKFREKKINYVPALYKIFGKNFTVNFNR